MNEVHPPRPCVVAYFTGVRIGQMHRLRRIWEQDSNPPSRLSAFLGSFNCELLTPSVDTLASEFLDEARRARANEATANIAEHLSDIRVHEERLRRIVLETDDNDHPMHDSSFRDSVLALRRAINDLERAIRSSLPIAQSAVDNPQMWFDLGLNIADVTAIPLDDFDAEDRDELRKHPTSDGQVVPLWEKLFMVPHLQTEIGVPFETLLPASGQKLQNKSFIFAALEQLEAHVPYTLWKRIEAGIEGLCASVLHETLPETDQDDVAIGTEQRFVPRPPQRLILKALEGNALRTDALAKLVKDRRSLFNRGNALGYLTELKNLGLVKNHRRLGYYRPDNPPPELRDPD